MTSLSIIGAGMAGLLAANMLSRYKPYIFEKQPSLPNNHSAVLRFRTSKVGDVLNIPFRKVMMIKSVLPWKNKIADVLAYSYKNGKTYSSDRSIVSSESIAAERWIAPRDFISRMAEGLTINYNSSTIIRSKPIISTFPMPELMEFLGYPDRPIFRYQTSLNLSARIENCDAYLSLYVPDPALPFSRISITGDELIIECPNRIENESGHNQSIMKLAISLLGLDPSHVKEINASWSRYAKILPIDNEERKRFIFWATDEHNIFSLGRYATWRPGLLLDDLVQDVRLIERWIGDRYSLSRHR